MTYSIHTASKKLGTYYSVLAPLFKNGLVPAALYTKGADDKIAITDIDEFTKWYTEHKNTPKNRVRSEKQATAKQKVFQDDDEESGSYVSKALEGDLVIRTVPQKGSKMKKVKIERVEKIGTFCVHTDNGYTEILTPWLHEGFEDNWMITTPIAVMGLLIKEFTERKDTETVAALQAALTVMTRIEEVE